MSARALTILTVAAAAIAGTEAFGGTKVDPVVDTTTPTAPKKKTGGAVAVTVNSGAATGGGHTHSTPSNSAGAAPVEPELDAYGYPIGQGSGLSSIHDGDANPCERLDYEMMRTEKRVIGSQNRIIFYRVSFPTTDDFTTEQVEEVLNDEGMKDAVSKLRPFFHHESRGKFTLTHEDEDELPQHYATDILIYENTEITWEWVEAACGSSDNIMRTNDDDTCSKLMADPDYETMVDIMAFARKEANDAGNNFCDFDIEYILFSPAIGNAPAMGFIDFGYGTSNSGFDVGLLAHELGHNFGLHHAGLLWGGGALADSNEFGYIEYGDHFDIMGSRGKGPFPWGLEYSVAEKNLVLGWIDDSQVLKITDEDADFDTEVVLHPSSISSGDKVEGVFYGIHYDTNARAEFPINADHAGELNAESLNVRASVFIENRGNEWRTVDGDDENLAEYGSGKGGVQVRLVGLGKTLPPWDATDDENALCEEGFSFCGDGESCYKAGFDTQCNGTEECGDGRDENGCDTIRASSPFPEDTFLLLDVNDSYNPNVYPSYLAGMQVGQTLTVGAGVEITMLGEAECSVAGVYGCVKLHVVKNGDENPAVEDEKVFDFGVSESTACTDAAGWNCGSWTKGAFNPDVCEAAGESATFGYRDACAATCGKCEDGESPSAEFHRDWAEPEEITWRVEGPTATDCTCLKDWSNGSGDSYGACPEESIDGDNCADAVTEGWFEGLDCKGEPEAFHSWCMTVSESCGPDGSGWDYCNPDIPNKPRTKGKVVVRGYHCNSEGELLGSFGSEGECFAACEEHETCEYYSYGNFAGDNNCYAEAMDEEGECYNGFVAAPANLYDGRTPGENKRDDNNNKDNDKKNSGDSSGDSFGSGNGDESGGKGDESGGKGGNGKR